MDRNESDFTLEYQYCPTPDAEEKLAQVYDLILELLLADLEEQLNQESETC